jgi:hypothetical protein
MTLNNQHCRALALDTRIQVILALGYSRRVASVESPTAGVLSTWRGRYEIGWLNSEVNVSIRV